MINVRKEIQKIVDGKFKINLNGEWEIFETSLEAIREDIGDLTVQEIRRLKELLKLKLNRI